MPKPSPFTAAQEQQIILKFGELKSPMLVRRWFRHQYPNVPHRNVPKDWQFKRVYDRFKSSNSTLHSKPVGRPVSVLTEELIERVSQLVSNDDSMSIAEISIEVGASQTTVWKVMRRKLHLYPYKPHCVVPLTDVHKANRMEFCQWIKAQPAGFPNLVIFSDEKIFTLKQVPNRQNERHWAPVDPCVEEECRYQGGESIMCWACLVDGKVLLHWFDPGQSVNQHVYLDMLKTKVWPFVSHHATRKGYWFQQDGAKAHTAVSVRSWLTQKFHERVISHLMDRMWPPRSPDLSPLDYWFWGACLQELRRSPPRTIDELKATVEAYAASLTSEEISKAVHDILPRAEACILAEGGAFEHGLKKHKNMNSSGDFN